MANASSRKDSVFWSLAFRPFFLGAGIWSALALLLWIVLFLTGGSLPSHLDPLTWHTHAMLFGFVYATIAGFMLTAIPNWTGRPPLRDAPLAVLAAFWLLGRLVGMVSESLPLGVLLAAELLFPVTLAFYAANEIMEAKNWRNIMMPVPIVVLLIGDALTLIDQHTDVVGGGAGWRLATGAVIALISMIGGRVIPVFTRNWLKKRGVETALPPPEGLIDYVALAALHIGLLLWFFWPHAAFTGYLLLLAAVLHFYRLSRWRGLATWPEPLLAVLHVGYLWIPVGVLLLSGSILLADVIPLAAAVHALTAGAIGTMTLALMTRVTLGHTGRPLSADRVTTWIFVLVLLSALTRVVAAFPGPWMLTLLSVSALLWVASFLLFVFSYGPLLLRPRTDR